MEMQGRTIGEEAHEADDNIHQQDDVSKSTGGQMTNDNMQGPSGKEDLSEDEEGDKLDILPRNKKEREGEL